jgi:hypothetical protein
VLALSLTGGHARKALTEKEVYPYQGFGYRKIEREESRVSTHEIARLRVATSAFGIGPWS